MYVQQERFPWYYADHIDNSDFWGSNSVAAADPTKRTNSFTPSLAQRTLIGAIDFPAMERPVETRVFRGLVDPTLCTEGAYAFRVTSDDAAHLFLDDEMVIDIGGVHDPRAKTYTVSLTRNKPVKFEVSPPWRAVRLGRDSPGCLSIPGFNMTWASSDGGWGNACHPVGSQNCDMYLKSARISWHQLGLENATLAQLARWRAWTAPCCL